MMYIRTDMNSIIAAGHVMRCLAIADAAKNLGEDVTFILADGQAAGLLEKHGYQRIIMGTQWNDMDAELPVMKQLIEKHRIDRILIDSYQVTEKYLKTLSEMVQIFYIDDLNAFLYPVNSIICYASYWGKFKYSERYQKTRLFLGTKYAPLRKEFAGCRKKKISPGAEKLLLLSGGADRHHALGQILDVLDFSRYSQVDVICGQYNTQRDALKKYQDLHGNVKVHGPVSDMEKFMEEADLAVSAGGSTLYELCAVGTPAISYSVADNQLENVRQFHKDGIIDYAGDVRWDDVAGTIRKCLEVYGPDQKLRRERSVKMQELVDGKGAWRIAKALAGH